MAADGTVNGGWRSARPRPYLWRMLRLGPCGCDALDYLRVHRPAWMRRLFPTRQLFRCPNCGARLFYRR